MVSGMGVFSGCVCVVDGYGLEFMAFYMFTCLVLKCMLSMNFGTSQRALSFFPKLEFFTGFGYFF